MSRDRLLSPELLYRVNWHVSMSDTGEGIPMASVANGAMQLGFFTSQELLWISFCLPHMKAPAWPNYWEGDGIEIFLSAFDWKTSSFGSHHFILFPEAVNGCYCYDLAASHESVLNVQELELSIKEERKLSLGVPLRSISGWDRSHPSCGFACCLYREAFDPFWWPGDGRVLDRISGFWTQLNIGV